MIDIKLRKKQGAFKINAEFKSGVTGVTALFGQSGAGKTSVINMIAGLDIPDSGYIRVNQNPLFDAQKHINLPPQKRKIGYVFQDGRLFPHLTVKQNLSYGMRLVSQQERYVMFDPVISLLGISHLLSRLPRKLSGGEKQRVAIGRALLTSPSLLLMDEPLSSLDHLRKKEVMPFISRLSKEFSIPIIYVSHSLDEVLNLADHIVLMDEGNVIAAGSIDAIVNRSDLFSLMGGQDCGSIISATVETDNDAYGLTHLRFPGGVIKVPRLAVSKGSTVRIRIPVRSVSISLVKPADTSIQNIFSGVIEEISLPDSTFSDIRINIGVPLFSRITRLSQEKLCLTPGKTVFAMVKSIAVTNGSND
ncbi:MAG: molybdenum ABC transporter ATP-binding protein [Proteobacteria bacterium]|nr:molybdenum ABC transporter ATP-binding protein [Pseudomonadota bacterium]